MIPTRHESRDVCGECKSCNGTLCNPAREQMRSYFGIRITADCFDCALPVAMDSHTVCSFRCTYCFSENLFGHQQQKGMKIGQTNPKDVEQLFSGETNNPRLRLFRSILDTRKSSGGFPCPIQLGAINDPGDNIERNQGWLLQILPLVQKYGQPLRISTKGRTFKEPDYLKAFSKIAHLIWVAFSIITPDDGLIKQIDRGAPSASERLATMKALSKLGVKTSLRLRPIFPGITDRTPKHPNAYKELIQRAAEAGASAISYECGFYPSRIPKDRVEGWRTMAMLSGVPMRSIYQSFGTQACTRPSYLWTENIMHAIRDEAKKCGLTIGVSDPVWKQLTETGCCCGILPNDPVFGGWNRFNGTESLLQSRVAKKPMTFESVVPQWAKDIPLAGLFFPGAGPNARWKSKHYTLYDVRVKQWNDLTSDRGPAVYFQGAMVPSGVDKNGFRIFKYKGLQRKNKKSVPYWSV